MVWAQMIATWATMEAANQDQYKAPWGLNQNSLEESPAEFMGDFRNGAIDFNWDMVRTLSLTCFTTYARPSLFFCR